MDENKKNYQNRAILSRELNGLKMIGSFFSKLNLILNWKIKNKYK